MSAPVYRYMASVTPSDTVPPATFPVTGIYVGGAGDLTVETYDGQTIKFDSVAAGTLLPIAVAKIMSTGTAATEIVALGVLPDKSFN